jgi:hypothetical protein
LKQDGKLKLVKKDKWENDLSVKKLVKCTKHSCIIADSKEKQNKSREIIKVHSQQQQQQQQQQRSKKHNLLLAC